MYVTSCHEFLNPKLVFYDCNLITESIVQEFEKSCMKTELSNDYFLNNANKHKQD